MKKVNVYFLLFLVSFLITSSDRLQADLTEHGKTSEGRRQTREDLPSAWSHFKSFLQRRKVVIAGTAVTAAAVIVFALGVYLGRKKKLAGPGVYGGPLLPEISYSIKGKRSAMEDAHQIVPDLIPGQNVSYYAVFDGHGGDYVANYCAQNLHSILKEKLKKNPNDIKKAIRDAIEQIDRKENFGNDISGTTVIVALIKGNQLYIANIGDSRAVLCVDGKVEFSSKDHKPSDAQEEERIRQAGGWVEWGRMQGILAVSRAIGDFVPDKKFPPGLIAEPDITQIDITPGTEFLILACDGVWDTVENQEAVDLVKGVLDGGGTQNTASKELVEKAYEKGSGDNITAMVITFFKK